MSTTDDLLMLQKVNMKYKLTRECSGEMMGVRVVFAGDDDQVGPTWDGYIVEVTDIPTNLIFSNFQAIAGLLSAWFKEKAPPYRMTYMYIMERVKRANEKTRMAYETARIER